jgi:uncharacterized membrane protein
MLGIFHTLCGVLGLATGAIVFFLVKGTKLHIRIGWAYVISMLGVNFSALAIYHLTGTFNIFHVLALINLVMVGIGLAQVVRRPRRPAWLWRHYQYMSWSYVGLLAATCNEAFVRLPPLKQLTAATTVWLPQLALALLIAAAAAMIFMRQARMLARYGAALENIPDSTSP